MQNFIHSVAVFFAPKPVRVRILEAVNDCGEKRYIEMERDRREDLNILFTKCKKLLSFITKNKWDDDAYKRLVKLIENVRLAMYKEDDITPLIEEFESIENFFKKSSRSSMNLSRLEF
jgi:transcriptional regulator of aromatic amino acid metabolism